MQALEKGRMSRRLGSICCLQYLQMPYSPLSILAKAELMSLRVLARTRSASRLVLCSLTS